MKQPLTLLLFLLLLILSSPVHAQTPAVEWQHCYGGSAGDYASDVQQTTDGGFILAGYTEGNDKDVVGYHGNVLINDIWILKVDKEGKTEWKKCFGNIYMNILNGSSIKQTPDGGYVFAGSSISADCNGFTSDYSLEFWVVKLDSKGNIVWDKYFGGSKHEYAYALSIAADGGYLVAGQTESSDGDVTGHHSDVDGWVIKVSKQGVLEWQKDLGGSGEDRLFGINATSDGGCIVTGTTNSADGDISGNKGGNDYWVVKLNSSGNVAWNKTYGGSKQDEGLCVKTTPDGGSIVSGYTASNDKDVSGNHQSLGEFSDAWFIKLDKQGALQWQKCYGGNYNERVFSIDLTKDGGYVLAGFSESANFDAPCNAGIEDGWALKVNSTGDIQWKKNLGGSYYDELHSIHELSDGSYITAGHTCSPQINGYHPVTIPNGTCADFWLIKLSAPLSQAPAASVTIDKSVKNCSGRATLTTQAKFAGTKYTYQWFRNGANVGVNTSTYTAADFKDNDKVVCVLTTGGKCEDVGALSVSDTIILHTNSNVAHPQLTITADNTAICNCSPVTFKATVSYKGSGSLYNWTVNDMPNGFTDSIFSEKNLKDGDIVRCIYDNSNVCIPEAPILSNTMQITTATNATASVNITTSSSTICAGNVVTFVAQPVNAGTSPFYQWQINGINTGNNKDTLYVNNIKDGDIVKCILTPDPLYTCAVNNNATSNSITISVQQPSVPSINITASDSVICKGSSITFNATAFNAGAKPSYQWQVNNTNVGTDNSTFTSNILNNNDKVNCIVTVDPENTCTAFKVATSNIITISINSGVPSSITISPSLNEVCIGKTIKFTASSKNAGTDPSYEWLINNIETGDKDSIYSSNSLNNGDVITCILTPGTGACASAQVTSNAINAIIIDSPAIIISPADTVVSAGSKVQLKASVTGNIQSFEWSPAANLENALSLQPFTLPLTATTSFLLHVINDHGCEASKISVVKIFRILNMPGAFTPNGDGRNDIYRIPPEINITLNDFSIYDRWGKKVFTTRNIAEGWDGTYQGKKAPTGTYVFVLTGADSNGKISRKGSFVLIR